MKAAAQVKVDHGYIAAGFSLVKKRNLAATNEKLALPCSLAESRVTCLGCGLDVLVETEKIRRVVLVL